VVERDLIHAARQGDHDAFTALVAAVSDRLYALAFRILRDAGSADDALQECLVTIWRHLPELRDETRFDAWAHRILVNACRTEARRTRRVTSRVRALRDDDANGLVAHDPSVEERDALEHAFARLTFDQRTVIAMRHYAGLPVEQIAEALHIPDGTVRSRLFYATRALRTAYVESHEPAVLERPG
jgi:RNA polymerase sigma-70 factor (ECF subfamily)